jgi:hypothetical protein
MSKRITLPITQKIEDIKNQLEEDLGIHLTYSQVFNILIHFYSSKTTQPKTQWRSIK